MKDTKKYNEVLDRATRYYAEGRDEVYMKMQFAEQGVDDKIVDEVLLEIKKLNKGVHKSIGLKFLIFGSSFIAVGLIVSYLTYTWESPIRFVLWGLPISGVIITVRGISKIIG